MNDNDLERFGNLAEAVLWELVAVFFAWRCFQARRSLRWVFGALAATFFVFGISDVIEARTGAWWRPSWLLFLKGACIISIIVGFRMYYLIGNQETAEPDGAGNGSEHNRHETS